MWLRKNLHLKTVSGILNINCRAFKSSSPDEVALVKFGEDLDYLLQARDSKSITLKTPAGEEEKFSIEEVFPFNSERKRMGIVVKSEESGEYLFYLKGADSVIAELVGEQEQGFIKEESDNLAKDGLRTLAMCYRKLDQAEFEEWRKKYEEAGNDLEQREKRENETIAELEHNLTLLGITGVEDLLQDDIKTVIENLRAAGIRVWMLTGRSSLYI